MGNRSKFVTVAAGSATAAFARSRHARRKARMASAVEGIAEAVLPSVVAETPAVDLPSATADVAHAPGHRHLAFDETNARPHGSRRVQSRPFAKHRRGLRHPGRG